MPGPSEVRDAVRTGISATAPTVSVVVPAFNDQTGVDQCLRNMALQTYPLDRVEIIVVDNGSAPALSVGAGHPFVVRLVECVTPGSYAARNAGVAGASGELLAFTDADCRPARDWLAGGVSSLLHGHGEAVVGGAVSLLEPEHPTAVALYQCVAGSNQERNVREKGFTTTANLFCTRAQFDTVGPFDERLLSCGDREWCWRAIRHGIAIRYEPKAVIYTPPRTTLRGAVRQARRLVAGRAMLLELDLAHIGPVAVAKRRSAWQSALWILAVPKLSVWKRLRVLCVATTIRCSAALESFRLACGGRPERR